ncbi:hypothetical protein HHK36_020703 [Tetracentron sinense]|uniref:Protein BONZAI 3 n=1 Tax=Tetracentron sinense TaxID=13715 RepID=A0A834YS29_TETSI|nr:hypothetical protein HHK36_020703 [Tetracentron sinense]
MGGCFSDTMGGQQAVGGAHPRSAAAIDDREAGFNDAVHSFLRARGLHALLTQLELSISASKLLDRDILSKSDPMTVVYAKKRDGRLEELGRTEVIMNTLDPVWIEKVTVAHQFEIVQPLVFHVYDVDTKYHKLPVKTLQLNDQEFLGEGSCVLSELVWRLSDLKQFFSLFSWQIVTKQSRSLTLKLQNRNEHGGIRKLGTLTVHAEEIVVSRKAVEMIFHCSHLENKDLFSKSDPFLRISRIVETGGSVPICKTEVVNNNLNPTWKPLCLTMQQFGSKMLKGQLFVNGFCEKTQYSFLDYISSGFELNFMVAVDLTASNGNPRNPDSLHYIDPSGRLNAYQQTMLEVGEVIQFYDSDRRFPAWGFGGRTIDGAVSHCFNLNGSAYESEVEGVEGIMNAYASAVHNVALAGPTLFGQVVNKAAQIASQSLSYSQTKYFILLIITDGVLTDLQETKDALVRASDLPLSILIVGVGGADFKEMEILDGDNGLKLESSTGRIATRDIVQFVPMREVHTGQISIVQALLEELPGQFLTYMRSRDIKPLSADEAQTSFEHTHQQARIAHLD